MMRTKLITKRLMAFLVILAITVMFSLQAFASVWTFGTSGSGANGFAPRGYSICLNDGDYWLDSSYLDHDGTTSGSQIAVSYDVNAQEYETSSAPAGYYTIRAWFDKNPKGTTFPSLVSKTYKDFLVVKIGSGNYVPINTLGTAYNVTISNANRTSTVEDPDGNANQWYVEINMNLLAGETYTFGFLSGIQANNGNTMVIYESTTSNNVTGYAGFVSADDSNHYSYYANHYNDLYWFPVVGSAVGTNSEGYTLYAVTTFVSFDHTITATN